ncbi:MAG: hypothetical protein ACM3TN_19740 [Alphaproteobacteria bacterium]
MKLVVKLMLLLLAPALSACATGTASPGPTLWAGLNNYHEEMRTLEAMPDRWPDRQRLAESIKTTYLATLGGSREFNRMVELDLRRREFWIAQRSSSLKPARAKEIQDELVTMNEQIDMLAGVVKTQLMNSQLVVQEPSQTMEAVATLGLLNLAIDAFSTSSRANASSAASTKVGPYTVIDQGFSSLVRSPEGKSFLCRTTLVPEEGASIHCQPMGGKS